MLNFERYAPSRVAASILVIALVCSGCRSCSRDEEESVAEKGTDNAAPPRAAAASEAPPPTVAIQPSPWEPKASSGASAAGGAAANTGVIYSFEPGKSFPMWSKNPSSSAATALQKNREDRVKASMGMAARLQQLKPKQVYQLKPSAGPAAEERLKVKKGVPPEGLERVVNTN